MACPQQGINSILLELDEKWNSLQSLEQVSTAEIEALCQDTLSRLILDFRQIKELNIIDPSLQSKFLKTLSKVGFANTDSKELVEAMAKVPFWDQPAFIALLSGRLLPRSVKNLSQHERSVLGEEDNVIQARIASLQTLLEISSDENSSQMILNVLETYKSLLICEPDLQNKFSCKTLEILIHALLVVLSHRKEYDHLHSMIKFLPIHRKIQFVIKYTASIENSEDSKKLRQCKLFVCAAIMQDLLQSEFAKPIGEQSPARYNLYLNLLVELALQENFIDRQLEKLILSATDLNVASDYYYLAANLLRLKMPHCHQNMVVDLISIGLTNDLSFLEKVKYSKAKDGSPQFNESDFVGVYRRMFKALTVLGFIVSDYGIRRLCIQAANVCEPASSYAAQILESLPECSSSRVEATPKTNETLRYLREQLETFQSAIRKNVKLATTWKKASLECYSHLDHLNHQIELSEDLLPLTYPGIEKYLKRQRRTTANSDDEGEQKEKVEKKPLDANKILSDSKEFAKIISSRLKLIKNPFRVENSGQPPLPSEVAGLMIRVLSRSPDFEILNGQIFSSIPEVTVDSHYDYNNEWSKMSEEQRELNQPNLFFDFDMTRNISRKCNLPAMFQEGVVRVRDLCESGCNIFDIGNVMIYAMLEKKMLFMQPEFVELNKNQPVQLTQSLEQKAFNYLTCRVMPEHGRLTKLVTTGYAQCGMLEFLINNFKFEVEPGQYHAKSLRNINKKQNECDKSTNGNDTQDSEVPKEDAPRPVRTPKMRPTRDPTRPPRKESARPPKPDGARPPRAEAGRPPRAEAGRPPKADVARTPKLAPHQPPPKYRRDIINQTQLGANETLHASQEIVDLFRTIESGLSSVINAPVAFDLSQICDELSQNKADLTYAASTDDFCINYQKQRNGQTGPQFVKVMALPVRIHGALHVKLDYTDKIVYDENLDNPTVQSTFKLLVTGNIAIDHVSHNIQKFSMDCVVQGFKNKITVTFRNGSRSKHKTQPGKLPSDHSQRGPRLISEHTAGSMPEFPLIQHNGLNPAEVDIKPVISEADSSQPIESFHIPTTVFDQIHATQSSPVQTVAASQYIPENPVPIHHDFVSPTFVKNESFLNDTMCSENGEAFQVMATSTTQFQHANGYHHLPEPMDYSHEAYHTQQSVHAPEEFVQSIKVEPDVGMFLNSSSEMRFGQSEASLFEPNCNIKLEQEEEMEPASQPEVGQPEVNQQEVDQPEVAQPEVTQQEVDQPMEESSAMEVEHFGDLPPEQMVVEQVEVKVKVKEEIFEQPEVAEQEFLQQTRAEFQPHPHQDFPPQPKHDFKPEQQQDFTPEQHVEAPMLDPEPVDAKFQITDQQMTFETKMRNEDTRARPLSKKLNGDASAQIAEPWPKKFEPPMEAIDFEAELDSIGTVVPIIRHESVIKKVSRRHDTPPTSPPAMKPLHFPKSVEEKILRRKDQSLDRILSNTPPKDEAEVVIDLTDERDPLMDINPGQMYCETDSGVVTVESDDEDDDFKKVNDLKVKNRMQLLARPAPQELKEELVQEAEERVWEVRCVDVMKRINREALKPTMTVEIVPTKVNLPPNHVLPIFRPSRRDYVLREVDLEPPYVDPEEVVTDIRQSTFHIVYQNSVSFRPHAGRSGEGIANSLLTTANQDSLISKTRPLESTLNNSKIVKSALTLLHRGATGASNQLARSYADVDIAKTLYSDKNTLNFTKNLKNCKKFNHWSPKINNDAVTNTKLAEFDEKKPAKVDDPLCQLSHDILDSIPGLKSLEFFQLASIPQRTVQVIHVYKDMKNGNSHAASDTSDNEHHSDASHSQNEVMNGESSTHVQRIGQTSINRESDPKSVQTSFGSVVKNTYPPATLTSRGLNGSEIAKVLDKDQQKFVKLRGDDVQIKKIINHEVKANSNIKIVACSSNSTATQVEAAQKGNRNQTLINMLTQQVMLPTNSNRHFIITSNKADAMKSENNVTTVTTSVPANQNVVKKVVTTGQSQLVQILNSPPSSFTMKPSPAASKPPTQLVTVAPTVSSSGTFKSELPTQAKQQGIVQFICKTDGKIIHLTPICNNSAGGSSKKITYKVDTSGAKGPTILHHANQQIIINNQLKKSDNQNILTIIQKQDDGDKRSKSPMLTVSQSPSTPTSPISTRSIYEETYAKFIQTSTNNKVADMGLLTISSTPAHPSTTNSSQSSIIQKIGKTVIQSSNQVLPKFNQAFGKTVFTTTNEQLKNKIIGKDILTSRQMSVSFTETKPVTKITRNISEIKSGDAGTFLSLIENDGSDKQQLPTLQTALQSNLLYARPIGNGKLITSNGNNVLLTALRGNNQTGNVRIITSIAESSSRGAGQTIMAPMRISVPIQIPKLINTSTRPQTPGTFRQQIVIAATPTRMQQTLSNQQPVVASKLENLLMTTQPTVVKQEVELEQKQAIKVEAKQKKNVDHSTLEQLREFDMVLEQVLERSSSEVTSTSMSSPTTPESGQSSSPKKVITIEGGKTKTEVKLNAVTTITSISPSVSPSPKAMAGGNSALKAAPKLQEDEHTAQRILDILANYKEQVRNSPDLNNKPAPRRRANPPTNPPAAKRKKVTAGGMKSSKQFGSTSDMMTDTMGSEEDSSCGMGSGVASTGSMNNSPQPQDIDDHTDVSMDNNFYMEDSKRETALSPQSSSSSVATSPSHNKFPISRRLILTEAKTSSGSDIISSPSKNIVITNSPSPSSSGSLSASIERFGGQGSTAVLMPGNYLLPMNVLKGGQQLAILSSNNGQKIIAVPTNQLTSAVGNSTGTSIILQRYLNQANDAGNKTILSPSDSSQNAFKSVRLQQSPTVTYVNHKPSAVPTSGSTLYIRPIQNVVQSEAKTSSLNQDDESAKDSQNSKFVSDKTLITELIQQQQQLSHTHQHPQQNFMIKLNEHQPSDPRSSSSIMFVSSPGTASTFADSKMENPKIKIEEMDYDDYMKEDVIDLLSETDTIAKSPMLNTKIEADDNTSSNQETANIYDDSCVKIERNQSPQFTIISSADHAKLLEASAGCTSKNIKGFLIDPTNKIVMYSDRKPATLEKEFFNQKSFSEECADLGVDEPIASDLFPEADLLFESGSPKFDQIATHDNTMHIKKELENGQVLLEMNYNHNMETESWLNFDTEEELVDESGVKVEGGAAGHSHNLKTYF